MNEITDVHLKFALENTNLRWDKLKGQNLLGISFNVWDRIILYLFEILLELILLYIADLEALNFPKVMKNFTSLKAMIQNLLIWAAPFLTHRK